MKNKINLIFLNLLVLLLVAIFGSERAMAVELDTVWVSDINGQVLFQHPVTKNILVAANGGITELNSQVGKFVRSFPFDLNGAELSPDGTKILHSFSENIYIYDYSDSKPIEQIDMVMLAKFLTNDIIICRDRITSNIIKYNLKTKEKKEYDPPHPITAFATSPNGKYISYATYEENNGSDSKAYLYLLDAETMKEITELGKWDSEYQRIESISFSPNSEYLTYNLFLTEKNQVNIYNIENKSIYKSLSLDNFQYPISGFYFLGNEYYAQYGIRNSKKVYELGIYKLRNHEKIYNTNDYQSFFFSPLYNSNNNYLTYNTLGYKVICANLTNIISGIESVNPLYVKYNNKTLIIENNNKPINQISIMTIEGREVFKQSFDNLLNTNNSLEIPLELSNGVYIINITSSKESFTEKIIVLD